jgi:hypothetical protein
MSRFGCPIFAALAAATAFLSSSCAMRDSVVRSQRMAENQGYEMSGDVETASMVAEKVLQERGYMIATRKIPKGPGTLAGRQVEGFRETQAPVASGLARPVLQGDRGQGLTGELVHMEISQKWHVSYDIGVPDEIVVVINGKKCELDDFGGIGKCRKSNDDLELAAVRNEFTANLMSVLASLKPPLAEEQLAGGSEEYRAAVSSYGKGEYDEALQYSRAGTSKEPSSWQAWQVMGNCQFALADRAGALSSYKYSLAINPGNQGLQSWVKRLEGN